MRLAPSTIRFFFLAFLSTLNLQLSTQAQTGQGSAVSFDGIDDVMLIGGAPVAPPWTAELWVKRQDAIDNSAVLLGDVSTALKLEQFQNTRKVGFTHFGIADYTFNYTAPVGTWVHMAFVANTNTQLYVNGVLQDFYAATIALPMGQFGNDFTNRHSNHLKGIVDEVRLWNVVRSQSQIQANMTRSLALPQPNLVAYWRFDEGAGTNALDSSGLSHTGSLSNGVAWVQSTFPFVPTVTTEPASAITTNSATLNGTVNPNATPTFSWFEWGTTTNYGNATATINQGSGTNTILVQTAVPGLSAAVTYHYRLVVTNSAGGATGIDQTFSTVNVGLETWVNPFSGKWETAQNWS